MLPMEKLLHITLVEPLLKEMENYELEDIMIIGFDDKMNIIDHRFVGTNRKEKSACVLLKQVAKIMLDKNYSFLLLAHNHPDAIPAPSKKDWDLTNSIRSLCGLLDVAFLDHIIVAKNYPWYSFEEYPFDLSDPDKNEAFIEFAYAAYFKNSPEMFRQYCLKQGFEIKRKSF